MTSFGEVRILPIHALAQDLVGEFPKGQNYLLNKYPIVRINVLLIGFFLVFFTAVTLSWSSDAVVNPYPSVRITEGVVQLGSDPREKGFGYAMGGRSAWRGKWFHGELQREVRLRTYWMDQTLVTQKAYGAFVSKTGHRAPHIGEPEYQAQGFLIHPYRSVVPYLWQGGHPPQGKGNHPVVLVSHSDASAFCHWRGTNEDSQGGSQKKRNCRLPSEDEWELAARGRDGRYFPWGSAWKPEVLNTAEMGPYGTTPVQQYELGRSPFGLYDMAGNVFQWTSTPGRRGGAILKGCSWDDEAGICRSAARHERPFRSRHILIGFRCACDAPMEAKP